MNWLEKKLKLCIEGEHKGKYFVRYDLDCFRKVENGKVNRYPYYTFKENQLEEIDFIINPNIFNDQIEIDFKSLSKGRDENKVKEALVIAHRIINFEKNIDQFHIELDVSWNETYEFIRLCHTQFGGMKGSLAKITINYEDNKIYVYHNNLHEKRDVYGHIIRDGFDHKFFGYEYKKNIDLSELHLLNSKVRTKGK